MNDLTIKPILSRDNYCYLGIDENIGQSGPINKTCVLKEYLNCIREIWKSEISDYNKMLAHNTFAIPTITATVGTLEWSIKEINDTDIKTRKSQQWHAVCTVIVMLIKFTLIEKRVEKAQSRSKSCLRTEFQHYDNIFRKLHLTLTY